MTSLSPRLNLTLMSDTDFVNNSPVDNNASIIDGIASITQCTSSSRPGSPFNGQWIYETDTQNVRYWSPTEGKWFLRGGSGLASSRGLVNSFSNPAAALVAGTGGGADNVISLHDYSFSAYKNHQYKVIEQGWIWPTGTYNTGNSGQSEISLYTSFGLGSNPSLSASSAVHYIGVPCCWEQNGQRIPYYKAFVFNIGGSGTNNVYLRSWMDANTGSFPANMNIGRSADSNVPARAWIYDLGIMGAN
jgi:hypothetical protein